MYDFIVLGAGVVGMTTARELALSGLKIALIDKGEVGKEATWAAGGILSSMRPWTEHPASAALSNEGKRIYPDVVESLKLTTGIDPEYVRSGLFMAAADDIQGTREWAEANQIRWLTANGQISAHLNLHPSTMLLPDIAQVRPSRLIKALKQDLLLKNVVLMERTPVREIIVDKDRFYSVRTASEEIAAEALVISAGAWSARVCKELGLTLQVKPICGQMLCLELPGDEPGFTEIVLDGGQYLIPRLDGKVLVGSTMEETGFDKATTETAKELLLNWAHDTWPAVEQAEIVTHWAGLRPGNETGRPFIGAVPGLEGVYVNTAHFRKGILQAPSSARLLVDNLMKRKSFTSIDDYRLDT